MRDGLAGKVRFTPHTSARRQSERNMDDLKKSKQQLIDEIESLRLQVAGMESRARSGTWGADDRILEDLDLGSIFDILPDMIAIVDMNYTVVRANKAMAAHMNRAWGPAFGDIKCYHAIHGQDTPVDQCPHRAAMISRESCTEEIYSETMNAHLLETATPVMNNAGQMIGSVVVLRNISAEKKTEDVLLASEAFMKSILRVAPVSIGVSSDRILQWTSGQFKEMTGYSPEELEGKQSRILYVDDEEFNRAGPVKDKEMPTEVIGEVQTRWRRKDGRIIDVLLRSTPVEDRNLKKGVIFAALDITDRKKAEDQVRKSLKEKETLLQEIHHRVKNNMTVIKSLLSLQARKIENEDLKAIFKESQSRIGSMALIHESLYQSENLTAIDLKSYVSKLGTNLGRMYGAPSARVEMIAESDGVTLCIDQAVPCGLMINELMTNAFKYAFPDGGRGWIRVAAYGADSDSVKIIVSDNGVGIPAEIDIHGGRTLGFQLVTSLVEIQLQGNIELERSRGTRFTITFGRKV